MTDSRETDPREMTAENPVSATEVLGVLTGQVPVKSMPIAGQYTGEPQTLDGEILDEEDSESR